MQPALLSSSRTFSSPVPVSSHSPFPLTLAPTHLHLSLEMDLFCTFHVNGILHPVAFSVWVSRSMFSWFIHVTVRIGASSLSVAKSYSVVWTDHILLIQPSVSGHLGGFFLVIVNDAAVDMGAGGFVRVPVFSFSGSVPRSGIAESYSDCFTF